MNTAELIPYDAVAPILIFDKNQEILFYSGTGFFVKFLPYSNIFFVTAKHCIKSDDNIDYGKIYVHAMPKSLCTDFVLFSKYIIGGKSKSYFDDVAILEVDKKDNNYENIKKRSIRLIHQNDVLYILDDAVSNNRHKLRTVGFPSVDTKYIDYEKNIAVFQPRGFYGDSIRYEHDMYSMKNLNWGDNEGNLNGFSGAPVIEFIPSKGGGWEPIPVGIITNGGNGVAWFISINIVTDLIAHYLLGAYSNS